MLQSMTGFGKANGTFQNKKITVELKSLNSKNLDVFVRMPADYKSYEIDLRKQLAKSLDRGKVECNILIENTGEDTSVSINKSLIKNYFAELNTIADDLQISKSEMLPTLMKMPDVLTPKQQDVSEDEWEAVLEIVKIAIEKLQNFRLKEGAFLQKEFTERINEIQKAFNEIPKYETERIEGIKNRIENNLLEFVGGDKIDKNRFEQELIYYIEKIDIAEEKHRLQNNLDFFLETLNENKSQGKKLGFIVQEIGREINTLGSKSYHSEMQKLVVKMKDELEKIKEQILNTL
jgi:uncharacterized protein (TIGR00255 family)